MIRALVVYAHPKPDSYTAAVKSAVMARLEAAAAEARVIDLYADGFEAVLSAEELDRYMDTGTNRQGLEAQCDAIGWCNTLIFIYPTWWYGLPAILKGWLDRVLVPGLAFDMPKDNGPITPGLQHIERLAVFTTCGATWWLTRFIGSPGRRTLLRGVRLLCAKSCRTAFAAHYAMDSATPATRSAHLDRVGQTLDRLVR